MSFSDELERASALEEMERETALAKVRSQLGPRMQPLGKCYFCEEEDIEGLFCDNECRDMWQKHEDARRRNGR